MNLVSRRDNKSQHAPTQMQMHHASCCPTISNDSNDNTRGTSKQTTRNQNQNKSVALSPSLFPSPFIPNQSPHVAFSFFRPYACHCLVWYAYVNSRQANPDTDSHRPVLAQVLVAVAVTHRYRHRYRSIGDRRGSARIYHWQYSFRSVPFRSVPFRSVPFRSVPFTYVHQSSRRPVCLCLCLFVH